MDTTYTLLPFEVEPFARQGEINQLAQTDALAAIRATAAEQHADHSQYAGEFDGERWVLVMFTEDVMTKGGLRFAEGDWAMVDSTPDPLPFLCTGVRSVTAYSVRGAVHCSVPAGSYEVMD